MGVKGSRGRGDNITSERHAEIFGKKPDKEKEKKKPTPKK